METVADLFASVVACTHCGQDHPNHPFFKFTKPGVKHTHYTLCPVTKKVIVASEAEASDETP